MTASPVAAGGPVTDDPDRAPVRFGVVGIDHAHVHGQIAGLVAAGAVFAGRAGSPSPVHDEVARQWPEVPLVADPRQLLDDPSIDLVVTAAIPSGRAGIAVAALTAGKDVVTDKPGCTTLEQLAAVEAAVAASGRFWSVTFSERFEVRAVSRAGELVRAGRIGRVVQTLGMGPHRLNAPTRPDWFFQRESYGGILGDIASHQIDQFLWFTGARDAEVVTATVDNVGHPDTPGLQDFGEVVLRSGDAHGYVRVDWFTPDGLPTWGDGRLTVLGTEGYLELRKYVDPTGAPGGDHLICVDGAGMERIDCSDAPLPYYPALVADVRDRTTTACPQDHTFTATRLALQAQALAESASHPAAQAPRRPQAGAAG